MKKKFINTFKVNEQVDSCFLLKKKNLKLTKRDKPYIEMTLLDKTGAIEGRLWDDAEKFNMVAETGDIVHIKGVVDKFREEKQFKVDYMAKADEETFQYEDMVRVAKDREKISKNILTALGNMKNKWICSLADEFTADNGFMDMFKDGLGGKSWHNAYIGGLMEHTWEVMFVADKMCDLYPEADRDLTVFGAFIHDIGKVYEMDPKKMEYTTEGGLLGHITIGYRILNEKIGKISGFPADLKLRLEHIVLSHHGEYEQQSPVLPKTLEATIVYQTDELVSQANAVKELKQAESDEGKVWSNFIYIKNRKYYIKDIKGEDWSNA